MNIKLIMMTIFTIFLFGCAQNGEVFVPTDVIPIEPEEGMASEEMEDVTGEVVTETPEESDVTEEEIDTHEEEMVEEEQTTGIPVIEVTEGDLVELSLQARDPDGDIIQYTFAEPLDENGMWQTEIGDAGEHMTMVVASDGVNEVSQEILVRVLSSNRAPVLELSDYVEVNEGELIELAVDATDVDGDDVSVSFSGFMTSSTKRTGFDDAGEYTVTVTASDGTVEAVEEVTVVVNNVNRAPILGSVDDVTVEEGELVAVNVIAADPDKDEVSISFSALLDENGQWQTEIGDAGVFEVTVSATDGDLSREESFTVVVESSNQAPVITGVPDEIEVVETETIEFDPIVTDEDGDEVTITYSGFMTSSSYTTTYDDGNDDPGEYTVLIIASDGVNQVSHEVSVTVLNKNRPPVFVI